MEQPPSNKDIEQIVRAEWGRVVAALLARLGNLELAEDAAQDALISALSNWPNSGLPKSPRAWLIKVGARKAVDIIRREQTFKAKADDIRLMSRLEETSAEDAPSSIPDDQLALIFTCCHPALAPDASVALTLKTVCGLTTPQIARAFVTSESTLAQRIVRAKRKIADEAIPYIIPERHEFSERMDAVLKTIYLIFNEGYAAREGLTHQRVDLAEEAIRLGRIVATLSGDEPEAQGLLALMLLHHSRRFARTAKDGSIIPLEYQDREKWDPDLVAEGRTALSLAMTAPHPGQFALQAQISCMHANAASFDETEWPRIVAAYDQLNALAPNPIYLVNRAVALSYAASPKDALAALDGLSIEPRLANYQPYHAARADILARAGQPEAAQAAYDRAIELSHNAAEKDFLIARRNAISAS